jgi:FXSXX-COOH protein
MPTIADDASSEPDAEVSDLVNLGGLSLADLRALPESAIVASLRRILTEVESQVDAVAGFQSAI